MLRRSMIILSIALLPGLTGCAAIGQALNSTSNKPVAVFDSGDAGLNTALLERKLGFYSPGTNVREDAQTRFNAPMNFRIAPSEASAPKLRGLMSRAAYENPGHNSGIQSAQQDTQDISYVKMGGGSDIADWQACETLAGGLFVTGPEGFKVDADFDRCMRARGYKTEPEAQAELKAGFRR